MQSLTDKEIALILADSEEAIGVSQITKVLRFFGIPTCASTVADFIAKGLRPNNKSAKIRLFCSSDTFWKLIQELERNPSLIRLWRENVHSGFVFAGTDVTVFKKMARRLMDDRFAPVIQINRALGEWTISDKLPQFCGVMSGLRVPLNRKADKPEPISDDTEEENPLHMVLDKRSTVLSKTEYQASPIFLSAAFEIIDIDSEIATGNFDIREHFLSATPIVMFVKWAFEKTCWGTPQVPACLVIDDPLLKPQYGFLNFRDHLDQMRHHNFATSIAFIPWNWRRSNSKVTGLFKANPGRYSLSIHGCDHTGAEFGTRDTDVLAWKARQAIARMSSHESRTGLSHDRVMVFPQGVFSEPAIRVLKHTHFLAAVNTEVHSADLHRSIIRISDLWDVALMTYGTFPIFTRRYPSQGIENFAFDILLGKPCIIVVHHDWCQNRSFHLVNFVNRLNALNCSLMWRSLGDVVRSSCRQREITDGQVETEMYGSEFCVKNDYDRSKRFCIRKRESDVSAVRDIKIGTQTIPWTYSEGRVNFEINLSAGRGATVCITFHDNFNHVHGRENIGYKLKTMARRYLSEVRDNYILTRRAWLP